MDELERIWEIIDSYGLVVQIKHGKIFVSIASEVCSSDLKLAEYEITQMGLDKSLIQKLYYN